MSAPRLPVPLSHRAVALRLLAATASLAAGVAALVVAIELLRSVLG
ncbi:MAG TPA: hypothetical protein VG388_04210 [Solirubrobacteraceae bacterium]|jgi:hypothetical protein|nr:hypothetical protein [Solirubrobacteraceae bacterium]